jgi:hypothetical protein
MPIQVRPGFKPYADKLLSIEALVRPECETWDCDIRH